MKNIIYTLIFLTFTIASNGQTENTMREFDANFAHTVYFWLSNPDYQENRTAFETSLQKFLYRNFWIIQPMQRLNLSGLLQELVEMLLMGHLPIL